MTTVKDIWLLSTCDLYLDRGEDRPPLKLPSGGRLQIEHAERLVVSIIVKKRSMEGPYLLLKTTGPEEGSE